MATITVPTMTARAGPAGGPLDDANDFFHIADSATDNRLPAGSAKNYVLEGVKGGTALDATVSTGTYDTTLDLNITGLTTLTTVALADEIAIYDTVAGAIKKATVSEITGAVTGAVTDVAGGTNVTASPTTGNVVVNLDSTLTGLTSVTSTDFVGALTGNADTATTAATVTGATQAAITSAANLATIGTVTAGTLSTGAVVAGVTMTLGSDAEGDVYYRNSSGVLTRLAVGSDGDHLELASGVPSWATPAAPGTGTVTSVAITGTDGIDVDSGSPITSSGTITLGLSSIPNASLANSSVSYGGISVSLGASDATPAFDLADATNYPGDSNLVTTGTITSGTWNGTAIGDTYISSAATWNAKQGALTFGIADTNAVKIDSSTVADDEFARFTASGLESRSASEVLSDISASPAAGSSSIVTVGTISSGTWQGTDIAAGYLADTAITPGSYTNASLTVDQQGRLTAASSGATPPGAGFTIAMAIAL